MTQTLSEILKVPGERFGATGAFDCFVGVDARLHIDPHLLTASASQELASARDRFTAHFEGVLKLLVAAQRPSVDDPFFRKAVSLLTIPELALTGLGYAKDTKRGSAIGRKLAEGIAGIGKAIADAGVRDPDIFALMGLLQEGVGADRISDMTAAIILPCLLEFSARVARELELAGEVVRYAQEEYTLPVIPRPRETVVLVPKDILRHLPVAADWSDIDTVASHNAELRDRVNRLIGNTWRKAVRVPKHQLRRALLEHPELLKELLELYKAKPAVAYDLESDPESLYQWHPVTRAAAVDAPLALHLAHVPDGQEVLAVVRQILGRFKELVEENRFGRLFYNDDGSPRREKAAQLAVFGVADAYCQANNLDLSPEVDSGNGPVDFKVSRGYRGRVLAEVKLSTSSRLRAGFDEQVEAYARAEQAYHSFYLIVRVHDSLVAINSLIQHSAEVKASGKSCPEIMVIDARPQASASAR